MYRSLENQCKAPSVSGHSFFSRQHWICRCDVAPQIYRGTSAGDFNATAINPRFSLLLPIKK
jgi:hypothetical protein